MATGMAATFVRNYRDWMENQSDGRVKDWLFMSGPLPLFALILTYVYSVKYAGPKWMEKRQAYDLRKFLFVYNVFQICFNGWLFCEGVIGWSTELKQLGCAPVDRGLGPEPVRIARLCWWYFILKLTELTDTVTFVLRKKNSHVSALHLIHHGLMPVSVWLGVKFVPGGHGTVFGLLNTGVHTVMYSYYLLASMGPHMKKYLHWKRYITLLQMYQFVIIMVHSIQMLFRESCGYPKFFAVLIIAQSFMFYMMFSTYYKHQYGRSAPLTSLFRKKLK